MRLSKIKSIASALLAAGALCLVFTVSADAQQPDFSALKERALNAGIQQTVLDALETRADQRGMSEEQLATILEAALSMKEENLPADHLTQKALEGLSKGVPGSRIASYIDRMGSSTRDAARIVDPWIENQGVQQMMSAGGGPEAAMEMRNSMIKVSTTALAQNVPAESIDGILSDISDETVLSNTSPTAVVAAIGILPDLPGAEQAQIARRFVVQALKSGFNPGEFQKLPTALNMAQQRSQLPAAGILEGVSNRLQGGTPAARILQDLFNGNIGGGPPGNTPKGLENIPDRGRNNGSN